MSSLIQSVTVDYKRFKRVLNAARHPTFVGSNQFEQLSNDGGASVWVLVDDTSQRDVAASLVDVKRSCLIALSVAEPGAGLGARVMEYLRPNWARVISTKVDWFERRGFKCVGQPMKARTLTTQIMVRNDLKSLGPRVRLLRERERDAV